MESLRQNFKQFMAGNLAGWAALTVSQPLDYIKTHFQINYEIPSLTKMYKQIGFFGFYRGASSIYFSVGMLTYLQFTIFEAVAQRVNKKMQWKDKHNINLWSVFLAGTAAGLIVPAIYNVIEYSKIISQTQSSKTTGSLKRIFDLVKNQKIAGVKKLTKGMHLTYLRQLPGCIIFYLTYNIMINRVFCQTRNQSEIYANIISGGISGVVYQIYIYPIDVIKTNVQAGRRSYKQMIRDKFWKTQTFKTGFYVNLVRSFLTDATNWTVYENIRKHFFISEQKRIQENS